MIYIKFNPAFIAKVKKFSKVVVVVLFLALIFLFAQWLRGLETRVSEVEARPTLVKEVRVEVTATPSAKPTLKLKRVVTVVPSK